MQYADAHTRSLNFQFGHQAGTANYKPLCSFILLDKVKFKR